MAMGERTCDIVAPAARPITAFATIELIDELATRKGVRFSYVDEGASAFVVADGPATVVVFDGRDSPAEREA